MSVSSALREIEIQATRLPLGTGWKDSPDKSRCSVGFSPRFPEGNTLAWAKAHATRTFVGTGWKARRTWGLVSLIWAVWLSSTYCRADDSVWKGYQTTALAAELKEEHVLAERAWRAAVAELDQAAANDPRKFISLAHLALAQVEREHPEAEATIVRAEAAHKALLKAVPSAASTNPVRLGQGIWKWARARQDRDQRYSQTRAKQIEAALNELTLLHFPPVRLAQLAIESSHAQRDVGRPAVAVRHAEQGIAAFRASQINNHRLADALSLYALLLVELPRPDEATASLAEWVTIQERLEAEDAKERPSEADYRLALVRQSIAQSDGTEAARRLEFFQIGTPDENLPKATAKSAPLATAHTVLATAVEIHLARGHTTEAVRLIERLKQQAVNGTLECGQAVALDAVAQLALGKLSTSLTRLAEAQRQLTLTLGDSHPQLIPVLLQQALIHSETGEFDGGLKLTKQGLAIANTLPAGHPLGIEAVAMLARIELRREHGSEARQFANQAWSMTAIPWPNGGPHATRILAILTEAEAQIASPEAAGHLETLEAADVSALPPMERGFVHLHRARAAHFLNQPGRASAQYQGAMQAWNACQSPPAPHPFSAPAQLGLAVLADLGQDTPGESTRTALAAMSKLLGSDSQVAKELNGQGNAFYTAGRYPEAIWLYDRCIEMYLGAEGPGSASAQSVHEYRKQAEDAMTQ